MRIEPVSTDERLLGIAHVPGINAVGPLAIVIHGAASDPFDGLIWRIGRRLAESGIVCATVNLSARGLGRYSDSLRKFNGWPWASTEQVVTETEEFAVRCAIRYRSLPILIGHSWGALIAAKTVAAGRIDCAQLCLVSPMVSGQSMLDAMFADRPDPLAEAKTLVQNDRAEELIYTGRANLPFLSAATILDLRGQPSLAAITASIQQNVCLVVGGREHESIQHVAREIVEQLPARRTLTTIAGASHFYRGKESLLAEALAAPIRQITHPPA